MIENDRNAPNQGGYGRIGSEPLICQKKTHQGRRGAKAKEPKVAKKKESLEPQKAKEFNGSDWEKGVTRMGF